MFSAANVQRARPDGTLKTLDGLVSELVALGVSRLGGLQPDDVSLLHSWIIAARPFAHPLFSPDMLSSTANISLVAGAPANSIARIQLYARTLLPL